MIARSDPAADGLPCRQLRATREGGVAASPLTAGEAVLEFESLEQARRWYESDEFSERKALRMKCALTDVVLVRGA